MNILFIITRADSIGGAQVHVKDLSIALQEDQHKVLILTGQQGPYNEYLRQAGIESIPCEHLQREINPLADGTSFRYILNIIDLFKPDLLAVHSSKAGILGRLASKITKVPCVFTAHGWSFTPGIPEPNRTIFRWVERLIRPLTEKVICVSEFDRQIGLQAGMNPQQLQTVHNGMKDVASPLRANPAQSNPVKVAMVARFEEPKDHSTLIEAFQDLDAELILIGNGPNLPIVRQQVEQLGISDKVKFLGFRKDIAEILAEVQIFTLISKFEALPCTIIEAMRAGLPIVASDVGGISEIVLDDQTGYLIPGNDVATLHQKLSYLINNYEVRTSMGTLARQKYESQLTFKHMYDKTLAVYQAAILQN